MIRSFLAAFVVLTAVGTIVKAEDVAQPTLKSDAIITGDIVRIGDLIENSGIVASVPIFRSPDLGSTGTISADAVLEAVRTHALIGVATAGIRDVVVTRASRAISAKTIEDVVARALSSRFDLGPTKDIVLNFTRDMQVMYVEPSSVGTPRVTHIDFDARSGRFDAMLEIPASAGKRTAVRLSGRAVATIEVATVTRVIERGGVLKEADVLMDRRPRAEIGRDVITKREQAVNFAARNSLQPGRPLRVVDLTTPELVQRNETVTLVYEVPGIMVTVRGKAADGGAEGDVISVLNEQSKRTVQGTIIGPGRVLVSNGSPRLASNNSSRESTNAAPR